MDVINKSLRLERPLKLGRSNNSYLVSESVSSECATITSYEKLSETDIVFKKRKSRLIFGYLSKVFGIRRVLYEKTHLEKKKKKKKKRSFGWVPDPDRRWPVQGW